MKPKLCIYPKPNYLIRTAIEREQKQFIKIAFAVHLSAAISAERYRSDSGALKSAVFNFVFFVMLKNKIEQSAKRNSLLKNLTDRTFENRWSRYKELGKKVPQAYRVYVEDTFLPCDAGDARIFSKEHEHGLRVSKHIFVGNSRLVTAMTHADNHGDTTEQTEKRYYYHADHLQSAQFITNVRGEQYEHIEYTPYGELWIEETAPGIDKLPFRFTGKELDEETGLYYYGARYLDPKYSRWLSGDPALNDYIPKAPIDDEAKKHNENLPGMGGVFNVVNLHVYHYAGNNPVKYTDPDGRDIILLNRSYGAFGFGHNAVLIGNDKTGGWWYFSKDGSDTTNEAIYYPTLESFIEHNKNLDREEQYDRAYQVETSRHDDMYMIGEGIEIYDRKYSLDEKRNEITLEVISQNCADLCADIGKKGGVWILKPKTNFYVISFTNPNIQYEDFKKNNKGEEVQIK